MPAKRIKVEVGEKINRWTVICEVEKIKGKRRFQCRCECGNIRLVKLRNLRHNRSMSCGCLAREVSRIKGKKRMTIHGMWQTRLYRIWFGMKQRCLNPKHKGYKYYGGRGISICSEWMKFISFMEWAVTHGYKSHLTIERKNNNGDYNSDNCIFVTRLEQNQNNRHCHYVTFNGNTYPIQQWARIIGINPKTLHQRFSSGWSVEDALTIPVKKYRRRLAQ